MKTTLYLTLMLAFASCSGHSQNTLTMEQQNIEIAKLAKQEASMLKNYTTKPMYYLQVNKSACRVLVRCNDIPLGYSFVEDGGESMLYPINYRLLSSGNHTFSIHVYPMKHKEYLTKDAWVDVKVVYLPHKDSALSTAQVLGNALGLPEDIEEQRLPYYSASGTFEATLPFDYSARLSKAQDLRKIPDIEELVAKKYKDIRKLMVDCNELEYNKQRIRYLYPNSDMVYLTEEEIKLATTNGDCFNPDLLGREVVPLENYEMVICGNGKIVYLRSKDDLDDVLFVKWYESEEHQQADAFAISTTATVLFMPEGSDQLEMFY